MEKVKLDNPIDINGKKVKELSYDTDKITGDMFCEADAITTTKAAKNKGISGVVPALNSSLHLYLGYEAIIAENPDIDIPDLERIKGTDIMKVVAIGRNFTQSSAEEEEAMGTLASTEETSKEE